MISYIAATNFLSWEDLRFEVKQGIHLIEGFNHDDNTSEGSGKSAILNSISWALFGKLPKAAKIDEVIRDGAKSCTVSIFLIDGSSITRSRKPNELYITKENKRIEGKDLKETQKLIEAHLGLSFETFCQSIYFAQNYPNKFITAKEEDRVNILSELLELDLFDKARKEAHLQLKECKKEFDRVHNQKNMEESRLNSMLSQRDRIEKFKEDEITKFNCNVLKMKEKRDTLVSALTSLDSNDVDLRNVKDVLTSTKNIIKELQVKKAEIEAQKASRTKTQGMKLIVSSSLKGKVQDLSNLSKKLNKLDQNKVDTCPLCGVESDKAKDAITKTKQDINKQMEGLANDIQGLEDQLSDIAPSEDFDASELNEVKRTLQEAYDIEDLNMRSLNDYNAQEAKKSEKKLILKALEQEIEELKNTSLDNITATYDTELAQIEDQLEQIAAKLNSYKSDLKEYEVQIGKLSVLKDGFKEIKYYTFFNILKEISRRANNYLKELFEVPIQLHFTNLNKDAELSKISIALKIDGIERSFSMFSGGQSRRIQLAVDLALSEIVASRGQKSFNIRFLDEYFKDLSSQSMSKILSLLETMEGSTILIEHNEIFKSIVNQCYKIEYRDNISTFVE